MSNSTNNNPGTPTPKISVEIYRCPADQCQCGKGGGALLCRAYRDPSHKGDVIHVACPKSKTTVIEIELGKKLGGDR